MHPGLRWSTPLSVSSFRRTTLAIQQLWGCSYSLWSKLRFFQLSCTDGRVGPQRRWSTEEPTLLNCGANRWGDNGNSDRLNFPGLQNHCRWWLQPWNEKMLAPWKKSYDKPATAAKSLQSCSTLWDPIDGSH